MSEEEQGATNIEILQDACRRGNLEVVQEILGQPGSFDINAKDGLGNTPLLNACSYGHFDIVEVLVGVAGVKLDVQNRQWETPLHKAAANDSEDGVRLLIEKGAKVTLRNKMKQTPAQVAASAEVKQIIDMAEFATKIDADAAASDDDDDEEE